MLFAVPSCILVGTMGPYDEPKAWTLLALVGLIGFACLARRLLGEAPAPPAAPDRALEVTRWLLVAYGAWSALATVASVAPGQSLWGGFGRGFGLAATLAVLLLFWIVQLEVRTLDRACRLIDLALIGSVPVVLLGLAQALGWDPLPRGWDPATTELRVRSTFGQHLFVGSYLVVLISLGIGRILVARGEREPLSGLRVGVAVLWVAGMVGVLGWGGHGVVAWFATLAWSAAGGAAWIVAPRRGSPTLSLGPRWALAMLGGLVVAQVLVLFLSTARGALMGLLAGLAVAGAILLAGRRAWKTLTALALGVLVIVVFVGVLNLGLSARSPIRKVPIFARLGSITRLQPGSPGWVRLKIWEGIAIRWPRQLRGDDEIVPGLAPTVRALIGFGPETQLLVLERFLPRDLEGRSTRLGARLDEWRARYAFDRAHNELLDHLLTEGAVGMLLWLAVVGAIVVVGVRRLRSALGTSEAGIRLGCLAAVLGQTVEGLVGIASPMPRALFWIAAGLLTVPFPLLSASPAVRGQVVVRRHPSVPAVALLVCAGLVLVAAVAGYTRWLLGSRAYATGVRQGVGGDLADARLQFLRAADLAPRSPFPAEALADISLRLTATEGDLLRHADWLRQAQEVLVRARGHVPSRGELWKFSAQVALARARTGDPTQLEEALRDFKEAERLRPGDPEILTNWAVAAFRSGNVQEARRLAEGALVGNRRAWLAWAVLSNVYRELGDMSGSSRSAREARRLAPPGAREFLDRLLPTP